MQSAIVQGRVFRPARLCAGFQPGIVGRFGPARRRVVKFTLTPFAFFVLPTRTRFPFRYGIATLTDVRFFLTTQVSDGRGARPARGRRAAAEMVYERPHDHLRAGLPVMTGVITHAAGLAVEIARTPISFFDLWRELNRQQSAWAESRRIAPLLAHLGVSLVERRARWLCRLAGEPLHQMVRANRLGLRLGEIYPELGTAQPADLFPSAPLDDARAAYRGTRRRADADRHCDRGSA